MAAQARLLVAAVPAAPLGHLVARWAEPGGAFAGAGAGAGSVAVLAVFALLARPLRLTELETLLGRVAGRLRRARPGGKR